MAFQLIPFLGALSPILEKLFPDPQKRLEAEIKLQEMVQAGEMKYLEAASNVLMSEAKSESWIAANWRPLTMLMFAFIIANNYIFYPYASLFWTNAPVLPTPPELWTLIKIGLGGYMPLRSVEKIVREAAQNKALPWQKSDSNNVDRTASGGK